MDKVALEILEKVNSFYSSSFSQLLTVTLGLVAFVGIFVPVLTTYYQNRNIKIEKDNLEAYIDNKIESVKLELLSEVRNELLSNLSDFEEKQKSEIEKVLAGVFHVQANHQISKGSYKNATNSILQSIDCCIAGKDELNLQRGLKLLINNCLPNITLEEEPNLGILEERISTLKIDMQPLNENGRYTDILNEIEKTHKSLQKKLSNQSVETA